VAKAQVQTSQAGPDQKVIREITKGHDSKLGYGKLKQFYWQHKQGRINFN